MEHHYPEKRLVGAQRPKSLKSIVDSGQFQVEDYPSPRYPSIPTATWCHSVNPLINTHTCAGIVSLLPIANASEDLVGSGLEGPLNL